MKKKGLIFKSWWFWVVIAVVIGLIIFFFPKSCGGGGGNIGGPVTSINCNCFGFIGHDTLFSSKTDVVETFCYGICLKNSCKTTVSPPVNLTVENNTDNCLSDSDCLCNGCACQNKNFNNTMYCIIPGVCNNKGCKCENNKCVVNVVDTSISLNKSLKLSIKASNPQYKKGQNITIQYTLENTKNETFFIPENAVNGIEVKNSGGKILEYSGNGTEVKILQDDVSLSPLQKKTGSFVIKGDDYDFFTIGSVSEGYYNTITAYIGDVQSNRVILRIILK